MKTWIEAPVITEELFTHLRDIIDESGLLMRRIGFKKLIDNSFAQKAAK